MHMSDPIREKLGAYLDGELDPYSRIEVQAHLKTCPSCRDELEELRGLSSMLRAAPQPEFTPALDFKAQFMLQLPRRSEAQPPHENGHLLPWLAPALILAGWIFIQLTLGMSTLVLLANQAGFLGDAAAWVSGGTQQTLWFTTAQATLGGVLSPQGQTSLLLLNDASLFTQNLVIALLWQVGAAVLYWGALALLWHTRVKSMWAFGGHAEQ
jgi:predicted anti-sigma-YlaC factor YlaD